MEKLGALWLKESKKGVTYLTGTIGEQKVVVFKVKDKRNERGPDYEIFKSEPRPTPQDDWGK